MLITLRRPRLTIKDISYFPCPSSCFHTFLGNVTRVYPTHWKPHRRLTFSLHFPHLLTISLGSFCSSLFEANFSTRTRIYTHIVQKKRKEKEKKKYSFQRIFESKKFDWNEKSRETLKLRLAPFYDDLLSERRGGRRERERERENCRTLEFTLSSASTNGDRKRRTKGQKFKINTCRGRFGKEIVIRVKHLSPLKQRNFSTYYKNTFISLNNLSNFTLIPIILRGNFIHAHTHTHIDLQFNRIF